MSQEFYIGISLDLATCHATLLGGFYKERKRCWQVLRESVQPHELCGVFQSGDDLPERVAEWLLSSGVARSDVKEMLVGLGHGMQHVLNEHYEPNGQLKAGAFAKP